MTSYCNPFPKIILVGKKNQNKEDEGVYLKFLYTSN